MKKLIFALVFSLSLVACGGGDEAPAVLTEVAPTAVLPTPSTPPNVPTPSVAPSVPVVAITDLTLSSVVINVKRKTVNVGERNVNLNAFTAAFAATSGDATVQELVYMNLNGGNSYELFSSLRFADSSGDVCPELSCNVTYGQGGEVRVSFTYGWRPANELQTFALQGDISPTAPSGSQFNFRLIGVQMRQWGKTVDGVVKGSELEVTTIVPLPTIISATWKQITGAVAGTQYQLLSVSALCPLNVKTYCLLKQMKVFSEADNFSYDGHANVTWVSSHNYTVGVYHYMNPGSTATWSFFGSAPSSTVYTQAYDFIFLVDGIEVTPFIAAPPVDVGGRG